ncbi:MAG: EpsI family protein [Proteobacteria bacterium]|nr:EpsI family protein [Pseudomonadota bacterium]MBU1640705.1 EpsI family protein [Pseudomonadota bacterium]
MNKQSAGFLRLSLPRAAVVLVCFAAVFLLLQGVSGTRATPILQPLSNFPKSLGPYALQATQFSSSAVVEMLGVTDYISYRYQRDGAQRVSLYAAYYDTVNDRQGYHSPKNCLPGSGWGIAEVKPREIRPAHGAAEPVVITEMIIRNRNDLQVVYYWYQNRGRIIASEYLERVYRVLDSLFLGRSDGSFIRIIVDVPEGSDLSEAEALAADFSGLVMSELQNFLPAR